MNDARRDAVLQYIVQYIQQHGYSPSVRDIQTGVKLSSTSMANHYIKSLVERNAITYDSRIARSIRVVKQQTATGASAGVGDGA